MFDQYADEAFVAAEDRAVEHYRTMPFAIFADIAGIEPFRQHPVGLDRANLPGPPDRIGQVPFELGGIERAFAGKLFPLQPIGRQSRSEEHTSELQSPMRTSYA